MRSRIHWVLVALAVPATAPAQAPVGNPHGTLRFECSACHGPEGWTAVRTTAAFDHARLGFALAGAHAGVSCRSCHQSLTFKETPADCVSCHTDAHRGELGADCSRCHTTRSFIDQSEMLRLHQVTRFPLSGGHLTADCESCHTPAVQGRFVFANRSTTCIDCHQADYRAVRAPDHQSGAFNRDCTQCHTLVSWAGARFDHNGTRFPLTGAHQAVTCRECHGDQPPGGTAVNCIGCHQSDYDRTVNPNHPAASFPTECAACHTTTTWTGASFDHNASGFPLTGAHRTVTCQQCHGDGVYGAKATLCVSCHQVDFDRTVNPGHLAAGFPTDCAACHTTMTWDGATFDHDGPWFPIFSGKHRGEWSSCSECHANPSNYAQFTCTACHSQAKMDAEHRGRTGYAPDPASCLRCHPDGRA